MNRMQHEIIHLRALVSSQQTLIKSLMNDNEKLRKEKYMIGELTCRKKYLIIVNLQVEVYNNW